MIHILNWHDTGRVQVPNLFALTACVEVLLSQKFQIENQSHFTLTKV